MCTTSEDLVAQLHMRCHVAIKVSGFISALLSQELWNACGSQDRKIVRIQRYYDYCCLYLVCVVYGSQQSEVAIAIAAAAAGISVYFVVKMQVFFPTWNCSRKMGARQGGWGEFT